MLRRNFLASGTALVFARPGFAATSEGGFEITRTEAEWRAMLTDTEYAVMREEETERAFTSPLNDETRAGIFHCKGCDLALYDAKTKFKSGTGWPSFYQALPNAIGTKDDRKLLFFVRTECHCRRCGSHLGHIFDDGPQPTGKRHCLNGVSLTFTPETA
ncbi:MULTISPECIES: peptide-methionine (R)-S-oxide reductase MsrB [Roseobacteraceae]|uniref:peptide-methionine (R)-S-oxide reductase n=1 Tax=Pseudosulfitobacter pseudonitzschiae TaxID=1402135 RepID=A0A221K232_9RHOB|nr:MULTISPECIES: peptide-methionine (R)-S-oxide reductase MsrB [Roseobacteraceae]ASM73029.1 peptide methionine sulfoxide reductase MsrB [Pseudosulfitobacter pseudonitzschiae]